MSAESEIVTKTEVHVTESGTLTVVPGGKTMIGASSFTVQRSTWVPVNPEYATLHITQLIGARDAIYNLVPVVNSKQESFGEFAVISVMSGQPMRKKGNAVRVIELGGVIEEKV